MAVFESSLRLLPRLGCHSVVEVHSAMLSSSRYALLRSLIIRLECFINAAIFDLSIIAANPSRPSRISVGAHFFDVFQLLLQHYACCLLYGYVSLQVVIIFMFSINLSVLCKSVKGEAA